MSDLSSKPCRIRSIAFGATTAAAAMVLCVACTVGPGNPLDGSAQSFDAIKPGGTLPGKGVGHFRDVRDKDWAFALECTVLQVATILENDGDSSGGCVDNSWDCELHPWDAGGVAGVTLALDNLPEGFVENHRSKMASGRAMLRLTDVGFAGGRPNGPNPKKHSKINISQTGDIALEDQLGPALDAPAGETNGQDGSLEAGEPVDSPPTGGNTILVVKVVSTDEPVNALPYSLAELSTDVFGGPFEGFEDNINLTSQYHDCSYGQLQMIPAAEPAGKGIIRGVIEVNVGVPLAGKTRYEIRNAVTTALQSKLGFNLPGPYQNVMYLLAREHVTVDGGWAAFAYINSWNSVYQGNYCKHAGVQIHEIGHNLGLAHSGGLNGGTYTDHSCHMGNPWYADEGGKQCFNPAKLDQLPWFDDRELTLEMPSTISWTGDLIGVADYGQTQDASHVLVLHIPRIATAGKSLFVGFNKKKGINRQVDQAGDLVTVVEANRGGYSQSFLKAVLDTGQSYTVSDFDSSGQDLTISVESMGTTNGATETVHYARVSVQLGTGCSLDEHCDNGNACDGQETCDTATGECIDGAPVLCDDGLFCNGSESCDAATGQCVSGTEPCSVGSETCLQPLVCHEDTDTCSGGEIQENCCGNGVCEAMAGETCHGCAEDCATEASCCGNGVCETGECNTCAEDCATAESCCGNGVCETGEDCNSCGEDCGSGQFEQAECGDGVCQPGEDCYNCSADCAAKVDAKGKPKTWFCCTGGGVDDVNYGVGCTDSRCNKGKWYCTTVPATRNYCCGDGTCEGPEDANSCSVDCP